MNRVFAHSLKPHRKWWRRPTVDARKIRGGLGAGASYASATPPKWNASLGKPLHVTLSSNFSKTSMVVPLDGDLMRNILRKSAQKHFLLPYFFKTSLTANEVFIIPLNLSRFLQPSP